MHQHTRTAILLALLLAIMSGLYISNRLTTESDETDAVPTIPAFDGRVPEEIVHGDTSKKQVIFTFDAGSGTSSVIPILEALERHHVKGTFFMTGKWALRNAGLARQITAAGHEVFNHSYDHPHLTAVGDTEVASQLANMESAFMSVTGSSTQPYFRPPYGDRDARVLSLAAKAGYRSVYWTVDVQDWMESDGVTAEQVKDTILTNLQPGTIYLMHVGDNITGEILDAVFTTIEQRGYTLVSLTQGL